MRVALVRTYQPQPIDEIAHPLGIMALDAYLRERGLTDLHLHDMRLGKQRPDEAVRWLERLNPDVVGLSALTIEKNAVHALARLVRQRLPNATVVVGGPYATSSGPSLMRDEHIDFAVVGEGEVTFHALLEALRTGAAPADVAGLVLRRDGEVVETGARPAIADLDTLPLPSWDRIDMAAYDRVDSPERMTGKPWAAFYTSRGCPYRCTYCHDVFGKRFRARSPDEVVAELALLHDRYGVREFHCYDDIFNFDKARAMAICQRIVARGLKIHLQFPNGVRADRLDVELLRAMKAAGTYRVSYAIETASPRVQKSVKKHLQLPKVERLMAETDRVGILMHGFFMLGFPGETREEIERTIRFALDSPLHTASFFLVTPFEGSALADAYVEPSRELLGHDYNFYDNPHSLSEVSADELRRLQRWAYFRFYANPRRMMRLMRLMPRRRKVLDYARTWARILTGRLSVHGADEATFGGLAEGPSETSGRAA